MSEKQGVAIHELDRRQVQITMGGVGLALFMASLDQTVVATAMPKIVQDLKGFESYSGVVTAYMIASTAVMPIVGKLSDVYGRKNFLLAGILWFMAASVLCGLAMSMPQLIFFRALQGIGAGTMTIAASTTIADLFPPSQRGRIIGIMASVFAISSVIGPLVGGYLTDGPGWRSVFYLNIPIGLLGGGVLARYSPHIKIDKIKDFRIDYAGVAAMLLAVIPFLMALNSINKEHPWHSTSVLGLAGLGVVFGLVFLAIERKAAHPIVPLQIFKNSIISISLLSASMVSAGMFAITFFLPLFVQSVLGANAKTSGAILLPFTVTLMAVVAITGQLISRFERYRIFAIAGPIIATVGGFLMTRLNTTTTHETIIVDVIVTGVGLAFCVPVYNLAVQNAAHVSVLGSATSLVNFMRSIGASLGMAIFGSILTAQTQSLGIAPALNTIFWIIPFLFLLTGILGCFLKEVPLRKHTAGEKAVESSSIADIEP